MKVIYKLFLHFKNNNNKNGKITINNYTEKNKN